jgi:homogentisate phytyltransferase/homogentisate geranylgeranyltransferase
VPPVQLKRHHLPAAVAITLVRGLLVNIGMFVHFRFVIFHTQPVTILPGFLLPLTLFIAIFSIAIAWFKDLPDTEGDAQFRFKTLSVLYSRKFALRGGSMLVIGAYLFCIGWSYFQQEMFLLWVHTGLLLLFSGNLYTIKPNLPETIKKFYLRFWVLFFLEYILFAVWAVI